MTSTANSSAPYWPEGFVDPSSIVVAQRFPLHRRTDGIIYDDRYTLRLTARIRGNDSGAPQEAYAGWDICDLQTGDAISCSSLPPAEKLEVPAEGNIDWMQLCLPKIQAFMPQDTKAREGKLATIRKEIEEAKKLRAV